jgi:hypothetical protein
MVKILYVTIVQIRLLLVMWHIESRHDKAVITVDCSRTVPGSLSNP